MQRAGLKKIVFSVSPVLIVLLHLPFVFAINRPLPIAPLPVQVTTADPAPTSSLYDRLNLDKLGLSPDAFDYAVKGFNKLRNAGKLNNSGIITIIDFSRSSALKRFFIIDLDRSELICNTYVSHGANSGKEYATIFPILLKVTKAVLDFTEPTTPIPARTVIPLNSPARKKVLTIMPKAGPLCCTELLM